MSNYFEPTEWKAQRLGKFTASEISNLLKSGRKKDEVFGQTALTYINEKIAEILTGEAPEPANAKALEWGHANELDAIKLFEQQHDEPVEYFGAGNPQFFPYNAFSGGSPDGLTETANVEAKCPWTSSNHVKVLLASLLPVDQHNDWLQEYNDAYYAQAQFNMMCCKKSVTYFLSYDPRVIKPEHRLAVLTIRPDPSMVAEIKARLDLAKGIVKSALAKLSGEQEQTPIIQLEKITA